MITDEELLTWIVTGDLIVDIDTPDVVKLRGRTVKAYANGSDRSRPDRKRYSFGFECGRDANGKRRRRTIVRAKLVYMAGAVCLIPAGFEIHHVNGERFDDRFENLVLVSAEDHQKLDNELAGRSASADMAEFLGEV